MKKTLIAVGAFAALLGLVLLTREKEVNEGVPRLTLAPLAQEVTKVEISGAHAAVLSREGGAWTVSGHPADEAQVKALLDALKDLRAQDYVTSKPEKHAELEVDDAKGVKVAVSTTAGPAWTLVFGKASKAGGTFLREAKGDAVFTTTSPAAFQVKRDANAWRKRTIATASAADVAKVKLTQAGSTLALVNGNGAWEADPKPPAGFRFDAQAAQRVVQQLASLSAQDFLDGDPGPLPSTVEAELKGGKTLTLRLGAKRPEGTVPLRLDGDPQTYLLPQWAADGLLKTLDDLRDTTLLAYEVEKVQRVTLTGVGKATVLAKDGAGWKLVEPKQAPAGFELDPQAVAGQLQRWKSLRAAKAVTGVSDAAAGLGAPAAKLELALEGGGKQTVTVGAETAAKERYVKGSADGLLYAIGAAELQQLEQGLELFRKRPPPDLSHAQGLDQLPAELRRQLEAQLRAQGR